MLVLSATYGLANPYEETPGMPVPTRIHRFRSNSETVMQTFGTP